MWLPLLQGHTDTISAVTFSPDGTWIASGSHDHSIRLWDAMSGAEALPPLHGHEDSIVSVAFSPDSTHIVSRSVRRNLIWHTSTGDPCVRSGACDKESHPLHGIDTIALDPHGWLVDFGTNQTISKLPAMIDPYCSAVFNKSVAIGTRGGHVVLLHFPPALLSSRDTRPVKAQSET